MYGKIVPGAKIGISYFCPWKQISHVPQSAKLYVTHLVTHQVKFTLKLDPLDDWMPFVQVIWCWSDSVFFSFIKWNIPASRKISLNLNKDTIEWGKSLPMGYVHVRLFRIWDLSLMPMFDAEAASSVPFM